MELRERFGKNLRRVREARGLTQEELGLRAGLNRTEISLLELGKREPRLATLVKLAGALGVGPEDLSRGIRWHPSERRFELDPGEAEDTERESGGRDDQQG